MVGFWHTQNSKTSQTIAIDLSRNLHFLDNFETNTSHLGNVYIISRMSLTLLPGTLNIYSSRDLRGFTTVRNVIWVVTTVFVGMMRMVKIVLMSAFAMDAHDDERNIDKESSPVGYLFGTVVLFMI